MKETSEYGETRIRGILIGLAAVIVFYALLALLLWSLTP